MSISQLLVSLARFGLQQGCGEQVGDTSSEV